MYVSLYVDEDDTTGQTIAEDCNNTCGYAANGTRGDSQVFLNAAVGVIVYKIQQMLHQSYAVIYVKHLQIHTLTYICMQLDEAGGFVVIH